MLTNTLIIYRKEMTEWLRDRRALLQMLMFTVFFIPLIGHFVLEFSQRAEQEELSEVLNYAWVGADTLSELEAEFSQVNGFERVELAEGEDPQLAVRSEKITFALIIPAGAQQALADGEGISITLVYNAATETSQIRNRVSNLIQDFSNNHRDAKLRLLGVSAGQEQAELLQPVQIDRQSTASAREVFGEEVGRMLPYLLVIYCYMGCMYTALNLGVGEKERGTLETLLLVPAPRSHIVLGKFLVVFTMGVVFTILTLASMAVWLSFEGREAEGVIGEVLASIKVLDLALIALMLAPIAAMFAAILLSISIYGKSVKEAYGAANMFMVVMLVPVIIAILPGVELTWGWAMVPITNVSLAVRELIKGTMDYTMLSAIFGSSIVIASAFLYFCSKWFEREDVLFRV